MTKPKSSLVTITIDPPQKGKRREYLMSYWRVEIELDRWYHHDEHFTSKAKAINYAESYAKAFCNPGTYTIIYPEEPK